MALNSSGQIGPDVAEPAVEFSDREQCVQNVRAGGARPPHNVVLGLVKALKFRGRELRSRIELFETERQLAQTLDACDRPRDILLDAVEQRLDPGRAQQEHTVAPLEALMYPETVGLVELPAVGSRSP